MYKICTKCKIKQQKEFFFRNKVSKDGLTSRCKKCMYLITKDWRKNNWEQYLETERKLKRKYRKSGNLLEKNRLYKKLNYQRHREQARRHSQELKLEIMQYYSNSKEPFCTCCGQKNLIFLQIDHIKNDGAKHRKQINASGTGLYYWIKRNKFPNDMFQVLCANCNIGKKMLGLCPHKL